MSYIDEVKDTNNFFIIDANTRKITSLSQHTPVLAQYDHNSERYAFEIPRFIEGHDMSKFTEVQVHYVNTATSGKTKTSGMYTVDDLTVDADNDVVIFTWLISSNATQLVGTLKFSIRFICTTGDVVDYAWNTASFDDISVLEALYNSDEIVVQEADAIIALRKSLEEKLNNIAIQSGKPLISDIVLFADKWAGAYPTYSQVVDIVGVTENSRIDLNPGPEQLEVFYEKDLAFVTENSGGVVTVYAIGQKPENDYTIQVTITEVTE